MVVLKWIYFQTSSFENKNVIIDTNLMGLCDCVFLLICFTAICYIPSQARAVFNDIWNDTICRLFIIILNYKQIGAPKSFG